MRLALALLLLASLAQADDSGSLVTHLITPCRYFDTRTAGCITGAGCTTGPFHSGDIRKYLVQAAMECPAPLRPVPYRAVGLLATVTVVNPSGDGYLTMWSPADPQPMIASLAFNQSLTSSSAVTVRLRQEGTQPQTSDMWIYAQVAGNGTVDVIIDVVGYLMTPP